MLSSEVILCWRLEQLISQINVIVKEGLFLLSLVPGTPDKEYGYWASVKGGARKCAC